MEKMSAVFEDNEEFNEYAEPFDKAREAADPESTQYASSVYSDKDGSVSVRVQGDANNLCAMIYEMADKMPDEGKINIALRLIKSAGRDQFSQYISEMLGVSQKEIDEEIDDDDPNRSLREEIEKEF